jgi:hypothetical protein
LKRLAVLILAGSVILLASDRSLGDAGEASFTFLRISAGSRPAALAEAVTASGSDITSAFYNPALLRSFDGNNQAVFMYNSYFQDVTQHYLSLAAKHNRLSLGGYLALGKVADIKRYTIPDIVPGGTFEENHFIGAAAGAYSLNKFDFGIALKYAYEKIDYQSASAVMFDAGIYMPLTDEIAAGAAAKNIGTKPKFVARSFSLAKEYRLGLAYKPVYFQQMVEFVGDVVFYSDIDTKINLGAEYNYKRYFVLRGGYGIGYDSRGISLGGGIFYRQFKFDYAFVGYKNDLGNAHRFTVGITF